VTASVLVVPARGLDNGHHWHWHQIFASLSGMPVTKRIFITNLKITVFTVSEMKRLLFLLGLLAQLSSAQFFNVLAAFPAPGLQT
jgi:hypothetical protein